MGSILQSLSKTIHLSIVVSVLLFVYLFYTEGGWAFDQLFWSWLFRYLHQGNRPAFLGFGADVSHDESVRTT